MRKAGVNPNLVNAQPAESGSSTSQPAEKDYTIFSEYMEKIIYEMDEEAEEGKIPKETIDTVLNAVKTLTIVAKLWGKS